MPPRNRQKMADRDERKAKADPFINNDEMEEEEDEDADLEADGPPSIDPYAVLGLEQDATADDVKKAYRKMALKHHPGTAYVECATAFTDTCQIRRL